jgi:streptomycin 6-kinase
MATADELDLEGLGLLGVDDALIAKRERLDGARALRFLAGLPALAACWQARLDLRDARIMPGGVLSAALACKRRGDGSPVVLKLAAPHAQSARAEAAALAAWDGVGACALLYAADNGSVMLLDAICPGVAVRPSDDDGADARRAGELLVALHRNSTDRVAPAVPDAAEELRWRFERAHQQLDGPSHARGLVSHRDLDAAYFDALALHEQCPNRIMCHGDLMNKNILLDRHGDWWAIDPRPCVGDPCLDAAFWAVTHRPGERVRPRCELVARAAGLDPDRVWAWALVFAVSEAVLVTDLARARAHHRTRTGDR